MSNLNNLTSKILSDSKERAQKIISDAEAASKKVVDEQVATAKREQERILVEAETEAKHSAEQLILGKTLAIRDENLDVKQQMLDSVFTEALSKLNSLPKKEFFQFIANFLKGMDLTGQEIILPKKYKVNNLDELNQILSNNGCTGSLTLSKDARDIDGGFILCKKGIELNNTFYSLLDYNRYDLEGEVLKILY